MEGPVGVAAVGVVAVGVVADGVAAIGYIGFEAVGVGTMCSVGGIAVPRQGNGFCWRWCCRRWSNVFRWR